MMIEAMAMISAEPVDMMAIRIKKMMTYSPVDPSSFWATRGAANPMDQKLRLTINRKLIIRYK